MMTTQEIIDAMSKSLPNVPPDCTMVEAIRSLAINFASHRHYNPGGVHMATSPPTSPPVHEGCAASTPKATAAPVPQTDKPSEWARARTKSILAKFTDYPFSGMIDFASDNNGYGLTAKEIALALDAARAEALEEAARIADGIVSGTEKTLASQMAYDFGWGNASDYIARTIRARKESK